MNLIYHCPVKKLATRTPIPVLVARRESTVPYETVEIRPENVTPKSDVLKLVSEG